MKEVPRGSLILDLGCGTGHWSEYLESDLGFNIVGIDISKDSVAISNDNSHKSNLDTDFIVGDARRFLLKMMLFTEFFRAMC